MDQRKLIKSVAVVLTVSAVVPMTTEASNNLDYRKRVIGVAGIMNVNTGMDQSVTRAEFARMLVQASTYRDYLPTVSNVSVYADVAQDYEYASSIRIAAEQQWMVGYLGGIFKPDQPITLQEASRGLLGLLGYTNEDFTGDTANVRMAMFYSLELNSEVNRNANEILNRNDCVNLFYNLLKTEMKDSTKAYATVLGCELNSDGEVNPMGLADTNLKGPKLVPKGRQIGDYVPFNIQEASIFMNGDASSYTALKSAIANNYVVIYYNQSAKTVWAYTADDDPDVDENSSRRCAVRGTVDNIYYSSSDVMTPSAVTIDGVEYKLDSSEMQFAFSIYGTLRVGDTVTLICEKSVNSSGDVSYSVIDYVED
ncbi:MAG: S-layer homology domain-containing protein [Lachnospiraceae bacterium]